MEPKAAVFDAARITAMQLRTPAGLKVVKVRFPTDDEWIERQRRCKVIVKKLGRGIYETVVSEAQEADAALLARIREGEGPEVDPFEASRIVEQLSLADVEDVVQDGGVFRVTMRVLGGVVSHRIKMPSAKDAFEYRRGFVRVLDLPYNRQEITLNIAAASEMYQRLVAGHEGYAGDVPVIHQAVAVKAAIDALDAAIQEAGDPN